MAYLFDTNALSEVGRRRPNRSFTAWLLALPAAEQFTSSVVVAELYVAGYRAVGGSRWLERIHDTILPLVTVIQFDTECARLCGRLQAGLLDRGVGVELADAMIAATAIRYQLTLVTANSRHYERFSGLSLLVFGPGEGGDFRSM